MTADEFSACNSRETPRPVPRTRALKQRAVQFQGRQGSRPASSFLAELKDAQRKRVARESQSFEMENLKTARERSARSAIEQLSQVGPRSPGHVAGEKIMMVPMKQPRSKVIKKGALDEQVGVGEAGASGSGGRSRRKDQVDLKN